MTNSPRRKRLAQQRALKRCEARFRELFSSNMVGLALAGFDGDVKDANDAFLNLIGNTREDLLAGRINWRSLTPPEYLALEELELAELKRTGRERPIGKALIRKDGSRVPVIVGVAFLETSAEGIAFALDLSEQKRVEEELRLSEEPLRLLVQGVKDYAIILLDEIGRVVSWNEGAARLTGYAAEDIVGRPYCTFFPPESGLPESCNQDLELAARVGRRENEGWRVRKDGSRYWANTVMTALRTETGALRGFAKITHDITAHKESEEALRRSDARLRRLLQSNIVGTHFANLKGEILAANDAFLDMIGYTREELEAGRIRWTDITPPEFAKADEAAVAELRERGASTPYEKAYLRRDGTRVRVLIGAALLEDGSEEYVAFVHDLNERKLHEAAQARLVAEAQEARLIAEAAERVATSAVKARDGFIGIASHELRTPISALQLQVQVLQRTLEHNSGEPVAADRVRRVVELVSRQSTRLMELVSNLMDVTRLTSGRLELEPVEVDLCQVAQAVVERLDGAIKQARCAIVMEDGCPVNGFWDPFRLEQVVTNLLSNALKYGAGKPIEIGVHQEDDTVTLTVMDQGIGIAPEDQEKIFAPFERASGTHASSSLGLGLYITDQIVRAHGGSIRVASRLGRGATFEVQLPRQTMVEEN